MLQIKKDGYNFDLYPGTTINMEINNPIFDDDIIKGNYSFPFKLPLTPLNKRLLNFPEEIANTVSLQASYTVDILVEGWLLFPNATLKIKNATNEVCNVYILVGISTFAEYAASYKIPEKMTYTHNFGGTTHNSILADVSGHAISTLSATVDTMPYVFYPVNNKGHYQGEAQDFSGNSVPFYVKDPCVYNLYTGGQFHPGTAVYDPLDSYKHSPLTMTPFVYITYILRQILSGQGVVSNIFETDAELKTLTAFNQFSLDNYMYRGTGGQVIWSNISNRQIEVKNHVPDVTIGEFLVGLKKTFCLFIYKSPFDTAIHIDAFKNLISAPPQYDWSSIVNPAYELEESIGKGIKYLPDTKGDKYLAATASMLNQVRKPAVSSISFLPSTGNSIGDLRMIEKAGLVYRWNGSAWEYYTTAFGDYYLTPAGFELKTLFSGTIPWFMNFYPIGASQDVMAIPFVDAPGSYRTWDNIEVKTPSCNALIFYRGMQPTGVHGTLYPMGSSHNYNYQGLSIGNYSLAWDGANGLYNVWWKDYLKLRNASKEVTRQVNLNLPALINLDLRKKVRIGANNYFIRKISLQLPLLKPAKVEFLKAD